MFRGVGGNLCDGSVASRCVDFCRVRGEMVVLVRCAPGNIFKNDVNATLSERARSNLLVPHLAMNLVYTEHL